MVQSKHVVPKPEMVGAIDVLELKNFIGYCIRGTNVKPVSRNRLRTPVTPVGQPRLATRLSEKYP